MNELMPENKVLIIGESLAYH